MSSVETIIVTRRGYRIYRSISDPHVCVRESLFRGAAQEDLRRYYEGWLLTHDLLQPCAPLQCHLVNEDRIEMEFIPGITLNHLYGLALISANGTKNHCPWDTLWERLPGVWSSTRSAPATQTRLNAATLWVTWFGIAELRLAKQYIWQRCWQRPSWSAQAVRELLKGKILNGSYTHIPKVVFEILAKSRHGLLLGDLHFENLVGSAGRLSFVDFTEVAHGPIALDLASLWFEWWLAQGLHRGDDGFLSGFRDLWSHYVGPESLLCEMTLEWAKRMFGWMAFAFYRVRLNLESDKALQYGGLVTNLKNLLGQRLVEAKTLEECLLHCRQGSCPER